ncbi:hypothetical protein FKR81_03840 [Lentzea tibetensis]|uniref:Uncharacterized protein n=1 Tax=Lentzea tibetensis TaxID=2591470 RepID=A0A563F1M7_9PSEU|nr:hypothetical protein [Lentzea tibetensis]TWP53896.1 hypothetical protein FKR81_03840 [Lentzea tibetensis]
MGSATTDDTTFLRRFVELAPVLLAATEPERLPDRPGAAEVDEMLTAVGALTAAVDHVLTHLGNTVQGERRYAKACRSIVLARECARWMCGDITTAAAALHDNRADPGRGQDH